MNTPRIRTALVTGGAKGIGRAIADKLSTEGFRLIIVYKTSEREAVDAVAGYAERGIFAMAVKCDVTNSLEVEGLYRRVKSAFGFVDTVVNNAGVSLYKLTTDCRDADYQYVMDNNFRSVFCVTRAFVPDMVSAGFGRIVNISSMWGNSGAAMETLYSASKAAVAGFTRALSKELAPSGITVNTVSPGLIDTDMNARLSPEDRAAFTADIPLSRIGTPAEVADAVALLACEHSYITGADIPVTGGL